MSDWEDAPDIALPVSYKNEADLRGIAAFSPASVEQINQQELNPNNDLELDREIARNKDPKILATLNEEKQRRAALKENAKWEDPTHSGWEDAPNGWEDSTKHPTLAKYGKKIEDLTNTVLGNNLGTEAIELGKSFGQHPIDTTGQVASGLIHGLGAGIVQGADVLNQYSPGQMAQNIVQGRSMLPTDVMQRVGEDSKQFDDLSRNVGLSVDSDAAKRTERVLMAPMELPNDVSKFATEHGYPNLGAAIDAVVAGGLTAAMAHGIRGAKEAKVEPPKSKSSPVAKKVVDELLGETEFKAPNPDEPFFVNSDGQVMRQGEMESVQQARDLYRQQQETARQETQSGQQPLHDPNKPIYVDKDGNAMEGEQLAEFSRLKQEYEDAKAKAEAANQRDPNKPIYVDEEGAATESSAVMDDYLNRRNTHRATTPRDTSFPDAESMEHEFYSRQGDLGFDGLSSPTNLRQRDILADNTPLESQRRGLTGRENPIPQRDTINVDSQGNAGHQNLDLYTKAKNAYEADVKKALEDSVRGQQGELDVSTSSRLYPDQPDLLRDGSNVGDLSPRPPLHERPGTQFEMDFPSELNSKPVYEKPGTLFGPKKQAGHASMLNDLAGAIYDGAVKVGEMVKDITGRMGRVIGEDRNGYRVRTEVEGGYIYSTLPKAGRKIDLGEEVKLPDGRQGTVRATTPDTTKVAIPRDDGYDLVNVSTPQVSLLPKHNMFPKQGGHGEMFKDLATLLARGAEGLRDMYIKRKDVPPSIDHDPQAIRDSIRSALTNSVDINGFRHRLEMANMPDDVLNSIGQLWNNRETVIKNAGRSKFSDLSRADQKQTDDIHTDYTTKRDELGFGDNKPKKDISWLSRFFNVLNVQKEIHSNKDIGPMLSWILSNSNKIINDGSHVYKDLNQHLEPYRDLSTKSQGRLTQAAIDFDSINSKELTDAGLQWPTEDMLRSKGLNDAEVHAYQEITHALDKAWDLVEMLFREQGMEPPKRIPGYFPHLWYGSYRLAFRNAEGAIVRMKSFSTAWHRAAYEKLFKSKFEGELKSEHIDPKDEPRTNDMLGSIIDRLSLDLNRPLDKVLADKIERAERFATQGIVTELIERKANLGGHIAEDGVKPFGQLHLKQNNRLLNAYNKYIQDISHFYANTRIANEVLKPFNKDVTAGTYENVPHFVEAMQEFVGRATGHPTNHLKFVDMIARSMMRGIGMPPNGLNAFLRAGSQLLYYTKLTAFSPLYVGSQILQPVVAARNIFRVHQERVVLNGKRGNPLTALGYGLKEYISLRQGQGTPETRAVMKYLEDKGIIDSRQMENIDASNLVQKGLNVASAGISKFLEATETHNRTAMTLMFYKYFRDSGMDTMHAIRAAATQMGLGMGEYARQHQAGMYTDLGMVGQQMKPFATLKNTYLGETYMNLQVVADAVREAKAGNVPPHVIATSIMPLALASMNLVFFAGLAGTIGAQEYNAIVRFHNYLFPDNPWLDLGAKLRDMGFSTPWIYGMLGTSLPGKPNIGPSLNAPGVTDMGGFPGPQALYHTAAMVPELIHYMRGETVDYESLSAHLQRVAPGWAGQMFAEWAAKHQGGNVSSASNFNVNKIKRTPEQSTVARLTGRSNIDEQSIRDQNTIDDRMKKQDSAWVGQQVKLLTNLVEGYPGPDLKTTIDSIIAQKRGVGDEIIDRILELHAKRMQDTDTQNRMEIANAGSAAKMQRLKQIYDMLHGK